MDISVEYCLVEGPDNIFQKWLRPFSSILIQVLKILLNPGPKKSEINNIILIV